MRWPSGALRRRRAWRRAGRARDATARFASRSRSVSSTRCASASFGAALPLGFLRQRVRRLQVARIDGERRSPVLDGFGQVALAALGEGEAAAGSRRSSAPAPRPWRSSGGRARSPAAAGAAGRGWPSPPAPGARARSRDRASGAPALPGSSGARRAPCRTPTPPRDTWPPAPRPSCGRKGRATRARGDPARRRAGNARLSPRQHRMGPRPRGGGYEAAALEQGVELLGGGVELRSAASRSSARTGYQSRRLRSPSPATSNGSMARSILAIRSARAAPCGRSPRLVATAAQLRAEALVGVKQEAWRLLRAAEPPHGLAEAGRGEVEQGEPLEQLEVGHRGVERRDQPLGRIELALRALGIARQGLVPSRRLPTSRRWPGRGVRCRGGSAGSRSRAGDR